MTRWVDGAREFTTRLDRRRFLAVGVAASAAACAGMPAADPGSAPGLGIATAPNPHVFPLILAMSLDPSLPVRLLPIAESRDADALFAAGQADGMLAMTYVAAGKRLSGAVPDLRLHTLTTWRGFFLVAAAGVRGFQDLKGRTTIVSGPVGSGRGGGGDLIFQAAARRQGVDPVNELQVEYLPIRSGMERMMSGRAAAITVPSPGSTGLVARSRAPMTAGPAAPFTALDLQTIFSGFPAFPANQLPLGGLHVSDTVLGAPEKRRQLDAVVRAYHDAAERLTADPQRYAPLVAAGYGRHFDPVGAGGFSAPLLARALQEGDLVYRAVRPDPALGPDLRAWLGEVLDRPVGADFLVEGG
ncbi:hypothetical protein [uncultured Brevundimonas sp.]|uniref:hypothetical protein n=1 Tax=uncultured Brevundimonas sp. TaxID=213418 RepID=UPI002614896C|nr:hypothetical protein [uncultured Brevundimonas sp.]